MPPPSAECLYVGDTVRKDLVKRTGLLAKLGLDITLHDKLPDVVLYRPDKDWLYFIEAVTSVGPMNPNRMLELNGMTKNARSGKISVTAFPDRKTFNKFFSSLVWDTEAWLADAPDHMIHLNGDKFLEPR